MQGFQDVAGAAEAASKRFPAPPPAAAAAAAAAAGGKGGAEGGKGGAGTREDDAFMQRMQQVEFDSAMVDERDDAINDIASSILEVNETMRDLANIVEEQGKDIDQVEVNVTSAEDATEKGVGFLTDAETYPTGCVCARARATAALGPLTACRLAPLVSPRLSCHSQLPQVDPRACVHHYCRLGWHGRSACPDKEGGKLARNARGREWRACISSRSLNASVFLLIVQGRVPRRVALLVLVPARATETEKCERGVNKRAHSETRRSRSKRRTRRRPRRRCSASIRP
jgi:hypothetical protein